MRISRNRSIASTNSRSTLSARRMAVLVIILIGLLLLLTSCVPGDGKANADKPANFLWGIWHGWVAPISLIISLFNHNIRVYETANTGWWYDFGFYMAVISGFGGLSLARRKKCD